MAQSSSHEKSRLFKRILEWNQNAPRTVDKFVHDLIQKRSTQHHQSQAVCSWDGDLTYAELDHFSSCLACYLVCQGIRPETIVPLCFEKSKWTVVSILAVLKAGGAFLLLDISQPIARIQSIVSQTGAKFALSSAAAVDTCESIAERVFVVDATTLAELESKPFSSLVKLNNAAYVIFTSGSTGTPKGVVIEHSQIASTATYAGQRIGYESRPRVFQFASYAFDVAITDILATLVHGGAICIPSAWERENAIADAMRKMNVTSARFTPSLLDNLDIKNVSTLETLILGGESTPPALVHEWSSRLRLILSYGPAECCVTCFTTDAGQQEIAAGEIGRPIQCTRAWIVKQDNYHELAEFGEVGELLIEGPQVARGYLNDQVKTNEQFVCNPAWTSTLLGNQLEFRLYRTGDLAKYIDDGRVCWAGRLDNQIKIRGQRLELEEVERALQSCFTELDNVEVKNAVVEAVTLIPGSTNKHLLAFLCLNAAESVGLLDWNSASNSILRTSPAEQERFAAIISRCELTLKLSLPKYAIPTFWIPLDQIPTTVSKKADRKRLRNMLASLTTKQLASFTKPGDSRVNGTIQLTSNGCRLQTFWAEIFCVEPSMIEPEDNFFFLGGDSVLAIKLVATARASGLDLSLEIVFRQPVLWEMGQSTKTLAIPERDPVKIPPFSLLDLECDVDLVCQEASKACLIAKSSIEDIYPCSPMQEGLLALSIKDPGTYILQLVYQIPGDVDFLKLKVAWEVVAKRTQVIRTRFFDYNSNLLQVVINEPFKWDIVDGDFSQILTSEKAKGMTLGKPMSRHKVVRRANSSHHYLVWTIHHALSDAWSEGDIIMAVEDEYFSRSPTNSAPPGMKGFIKYVKQQNSEHGRNFWRQKLEKSPATVFPRLPYPTYTPKVQRSNRISHHTKSDAGAELRHSVPAFNRGSATTATMIQAAWFLLIGMYSNSFDVVTGMTLNGRTAPVPGIDRVSGPTITTIPFRAKFGLDQRVMDFLQEIQNQYLDILPYAHFGLQNIRRLSEGAVEGCRFRSLLVVQSANKSLSSMKLLQSRSYSFPVMDFAIVMECEIIDGKVEFRATFDHQILPEHQVRRMLQQMEGILLAISQSNISTRISDLQKVSQADLAEILRWNLKTPKIALKAANTSVLNLIEQRVRENGQATAIATSNDKLSYEQLDKYTTYLATHLELRYTIRPGSLVAVSFEHSWWAIVVMIAVLKAGGVCALLDPDDSVAVLQRQIALLESSHCNLLLTSPAYQERLKNFNLRVVTLDQDLTAQFPSAYSKSKEATPLDTAFIIFSSGITTSIKGAIIDHQALFSRVLALGESLQLDDQSRVFAFSAATFYVGLEIIFSTLIHGGCIFIPSAEDRKWNVSNAIRTSKASHLCLTPTVASTLSPDMLPDLRFLAIAGEPTMKTLFQTWADRVNLVNLYGSPEYGTACVGRSEIKRHEHYDQIGRAIAAETWVVRTGDVNQLAPIHAVGELLISGPILAQGYIGADTQTGSAFIDAPIWAKSQSSIQHRLFFRTDDLVSYNSDGSLRLTASKSSQTTVNGHRFGFGEIENSMLNCIPRLAGVAIDSVLPLDGDRQLAAFLVVPSRYYDKENSQILANSPQELNCFQDFVGEIESNLHASLPKWMLPSLYVPIRELPYITASGKLNRQALQRLASSMSIADITRFRGDIVNTRRLKHPSTGMEIRICNLWKKLLDLDHIDADANFFNAGGGSVLAVRLVSMARREGLTLAVSDIFKYPILKDLAIKVREKVQSDELPPFALLESLDVADLRRQAAHQCKVSVDEIEDMYPCAAMQLHYLHSYPETGRTPLDPWIWQSQVSYSIPASLDIEKFKTVWNNAIRRYAALRTRLVNTSAGIFQAVLKEPGVIEWKAGHDIEKYTKEDDSNRMTFGERLLRLVIVDSDDQHGQFFVFTIHHTTYDAFTRHILFEELERAYFAELPDAPLPKVNQFIKYITGADKTAAAKFWTSHLQGAVTKPLLKKTLDKMKTFTQIEKKVIQQEIPTLPGSEYSLPTAIEVAAGIAIAHYLRCPDVIFYSDRFGRNLPVEGVEDLVGATTLFIPVRIPVDPQQPVYDLLCESQRFQQTMIPFEHLGWVELRRMEHLNSILKNSINMNINPLTLVSMGKKLGLELRSSQMSFDDPFGINVDLYDGKMEWIIYYDERFIDEGTIDILGNTIMGVFNRLVHAHEYPKMTVGELLATLA